MNYFLKTNELWVVGIIFLITLYLSVLTLLSGFTSSYAPKRPLVSVVLRVLCMCIVMPIILLLLLWFIEYIYDKSTVKYGFFPGILSLLIVPVLLILLVIVLPQYLLSHKAKKWCRRHQKFSTLELQHISNRLDASKMRLISPVSVNKMPIEMSTEAVLTRNTLYMLPGDHTIEFLISKASGIRGGLPISDVQNRMELTHLFKEGGWYTCELKNRKDEVVITNNVQRK